MHTGHEIRPIINTCCIDISEKWFNCALFGIAISRDKLPVLNHFRFWGRAGSGSGPKPAVYLYCYIQLKYHQGYASSNVL